MFFATSIAIGLISGFFFKHINATIHVTSFLISFMLLFLHIKYCVKRLYLRKKNTNN
jgi:hypothetical protein